MRQKEFENASSWHTFVRVLSSWRFTKSCGVWAWRWGVGVGKYQASCQPKFLSHARSREYWYPTKRFLPRRTRQEVGVNLELAPISLVRNITFSRNTIDSLQRRYLCAKNKTRRFGVEEEDPILKVIGKSRDSQSTRTSVSGILFTFLIASICDISSEAN